MANQDGPMKFAPAHVETFMGGDMVLPARPETAGALAEFLEAAAREVRSWGDDTPLAEVFFDRNKIQVTLEKGIVQ